MNEKLVKKTIVLVQLKNAINEILNETNMDYEFYKQECANATPEAFIKEILEIGTSQSRAVKAISQIQEYYNCDIDVAILLYRFTDAYILMH
jgi:hypothetical protein